MSKKLIMGFGPPFAVPKVSSPLCPNAVRLGLSVLRQLFQFLRYQANQNENPTMDLWILALWFFQNLA